MSKPLKRTVCFAVLVTLGGLTIGVPVASAAEVCTTLPSGAVDCVPEGSGAVVRTPVPLAPAPTPSIPVIPEPTPEPPTPPVTPTPGPTPDPVPTVPAPEPPPPAPTPTPTPESPAPEPETPPTTDAPLPVPLPVQPVQPVQPVEQFPPVGPSILPPEAPVIVPDVVEETPTEEATAVVPPKRATPKATPSSEPSPSATPSASASSSATPDPAAGAIDRADSRQGPNIPLLALLSVVILGCLTGLVKVAGFPRRDASEGSLDHLGILEGRVSGHRADTLQRGRRERH